jgi:hypothetical protein
MDDHNQHSTPTILRVGTKVKIEFGSCHFVCTNTKISNPANNPANATRMYSKENTVHKKEKHRHPDKNAVFNALETSFI